MSQMNNIGEIFVPVNGVHWIIPNFYDLPQRQDFKFESPRVSFAGRDWIMRVLPNGRAGASAGWFGIEVQPESASFVLGGRIVRLGVAGIEKNILSSQTEVDDFGAHCCYRLIRRSVLESKKDSLVPGGNLHVFFLLLNKKETPVVKSDEDEQKSEISCIDVSTVAGEAKCSKENYSKEIGIGKLQEDFKELLLNGSVSDIVLKVDGQEFKSHRCILAARSPVFLAMMTHDTKEKATGVVDIEDVDPSSFPDFLNYLYTGSVESVTSENAHQLYATSDIYQVNDLKNICLNRMLDNIFIENFCDVFALSLRHDEKDLKETCIDFFAKNSLDIIMTSKWQAFLCENPIVGNELFIKFLKFKK